MAPSLCEMVYSEFLPENRLKRVVECFWTITTEIDHWQWVLPDGCVDLLLRFNGKRCSVEVVETMTEPKHVMVPSGHTYLGVRFRPGMAKGALSIEIDLGRDRMLLIKSVTTPQDRMLPIVYNSSKKAT